MTGVSVSAGAALLFAALWFFDDSGLMSALLPAVAVHELGHAAALRALGCGIAAVRADIFGLRMDYLTPPGAAGEVFAAAAGPGAGILYALLCSILGKAVESEFLLCSAGVSFVLSVFNLLPASPLDGGRILSVGLGAALGEERAGRVSLIVDMTVAAGLILAGALLFARGYGAALIPSGVWILWGRLREYCKNPENGIK